MATVGQLTADKKALDPRTIVENEEAIDNITQAYVGLIIYNKENGKLYKVTEINSLSGKVLNSIVLPPSSIGAQPEINNNNKLSADNIVDGTTNKVVTQTDKTTWNGKQNALTTEQLSNITKGGTALQPSLISGLLKNDGTVDTETQGKASNAIQMPTGASADKVLGYENGAVAWVDKPQDGEKGDKGDKGEDAVNPFKGYYPSGVNKPDTGAVGDYLYAPPSDQQSSATATIWHYDSTQTPPWTDTEIDVSDVVGVEFGSGQSIPATKIKDENGVEVQGSADVLSAEAGNKLRNTTPKIIGDSYSESIQFIDDNGYILAEIGEDGIKTKNFDSSEINPSQLMTKEEYNEKNVVESPVIGTEDEKEVNIIDQNFNILAKITEDGIKTKNFDSRDASSKKIGKITLQNSDIITILGSSFGETEPFPTNKHWSGIMSMFSDYRIQNLSLGGSNVVSNLYYIRSGYWNVQGKYVVITNNENISTLDITQYVNGLDNLCTTLIGMGKIPIVCTNYHKSQLMSMAIEKYAYEHNLMFWDCSKYCSSLTSGIYGGFDDGAHLRRRNAPMVAYAYLNHLLKMGKPFTSIKVFDIRNNSFSGSLDDLVFSNNTERAKLFKEIKISSTSSLDEYNKLISNTAVSFDKYGLVEITIPSVSKYVEYLKLNLNTNRTGVKVYVKNTNVSPYPNTSAASTIRFSVSNTINVPSLGDVYSNGGVNYTVQSVVMGENNYYCTIYCTPSTMPSSQTGTLSVVSQVSGSTGSSSIPFVMAEEVVLDLNSFIVADNKGHWVELSGTDNSFEVPSNLFNGSIQIDKLSFLIEATSSSFQLKDVNLDYRVSELKDIEPNKEFVWYENDFLHTTELLPETTFGTVGTTTQYWKDGNGDGIVSIADYEQKYPAGATSMIKVTDTLSMNIEVSSSTLDKLGDMYLEIYCRYFPSAPTPYSQANDTNVNNSSFDFNTLYIKYGSNSSFTGANTVILTEEVGLYWKIARIPICWFKNSMSNVNNLYLSLYSNNKGIEVCKISFKYKN